MAGAGRRRKLRNYLLVPGFQLKYTGMVIAVAILTSLSVGSWLGYQAYSYSKGITEVMVAQGGMEPELHDYLVEESRKKDAEVLSQIVWYIAILVLIFATTLGITGIFITHRVVGPAYKLKLLFKQVQDGSLVVRGGFRKGDELQDVGQAFKRMIAAVRDRRKSELAVLDRLLARSLTEGANEEMVAELRGLRDGLAAEVGDDADMTRSLLG